METNYLIILINILVIITIIYSVLKYRYYENLKHSNFKYFLFWFAITLIIVANIFNIFYFL